MGRQRIGLPQEVEDRVLAPLRIGESFVVGIRRHELGRCFAREALQRAAPEIDEIDAERGLRLHRARRVGEPIFGDAAKRLDRIPHAVGEVGPRPPFLNRRHISGDGLSAILDRARQVEGERFEIYAGGRRRGFGLRRLRQLGGARL